MKEHSDEITLANEINDDVVIVRAWKSKNKQGKLVSVREALIDGGSVGHVSLQIFIQGEHKLYISFWPGKMVSRLFQEVDATLNGIEADILAEKGAPDSMCYLVTLD